MTLPKVRMPKAKPVKPSPLASILHPGWSSRKDHQIMMLKKAGMSFAQIAAEVDRPSRAVEQRYHRLRVVPEVIKKLEAHGLNSRPYQVGARV